MYESLPNTTVAGVGGTRVGVVGRGTIYLCSECDDKVHMLQLNDVFHIPETESNILSVGCWEEIWGRSALVKYRKMTLTTEDNILIARGPKISNKLYWLSFVLASVPPSGFEPEATCFTTNIEMIPWEILH